MKPQRILVPIKNGKKLSIDVYGGGDSWNDEISIGIVDETNCYTQDIVCVRESFKTNDTIEVLVYGDTYNDDYTDRYEISIYEESEE